MVETVNTSIDESWGDQAGNALTRHGFKNPRGQGLTYVFGIDTSGNLELHERSSGGSWSLKSTIETGAGTTRMVDCALFEDPTNSQLVVHLVYSSYLATNTAQISYRRLRIADSNSALTTGAAQQVDVGGSGAEATRATCAMLPNGYLVIAYVKNNKTKGNNFYDIVITGTNTSGTNISDAPTFVTPELVPGFDPSDAANSTDQDKTDAHVRVAAWPSGLTWDGIVACRGGDTATAGTYDYGVNEFDFAGGTFTFDTEQVVTTAVTARQSNIVTDTETTPRAHYFLYYPQGGGSLDVEHRFMNNNSTLSSSFTVVDVSVEGAVDYGTIAVDTSASPADLYFMWETGTGTWNKKTTPVNSISWSSSSTLFTDANNAVAPMSAWHQDVDSSLHVFYRIGTTTLKYHEEPVGGTRTGAGAETLAPLEEAGTGTVLIEGTGAETLTSLEEASTGTVLIEGAGAETLAPLEEAGTGTVVNEGTGTETLAPLEETGTGTVEVEGTGTETLAPLEETSTGTVLIEGTGAETLAPLEETSTGTVISPATGIGSETLAPLEEAGAGTVLVEGTGAETLAPLEEAGTGTVLVEGTGAETTAPLEETGTGTVTSADVTGAGAETIAPLEETSAGTVLVEGTGAETIASLEETSAGTVLVEGTGAETIAPLEETSTGTVEILGIGAETLASIKEAGIGTGGLPRKVSNEFTLYIERNRGFNLPLF